MGASSPGVVENVSGIEDPPAPNEFELTLLGPGYGESVVLHMGGNSWAVVDSCATGDGMPAALQYLESAGVAPEDSIALVIATHWHDDHIRGLARLLEVSSSAKFCCAGALSQKEFVTLVGALEGRHFSATGSGLRELHRIFKRLGETGKSPVYAFPNRLVSRQRFCKLWSLSPSDAAFQKFVQSVSESTPRKGEGKKRITAPTPNEAAVALWIDAGEFALLLGADLEKRGWQAILRNQERPLGSASVFKVPHHGSENAHEPEVWCRMLQSQPIAVLTPWRRGCGKLPTRQDARRILVSADEAYITAGRLSEGRQPHRQNHAVARTLRESGVAFRKLTSLPGVVRLRRQFGPGTHWTIETFAGACHLADYAA